MRAKRPLADTRALLTSLCLPHSEFQPAELAQRRVTFHLYKSTEAQPYFVTEKGVVPVGHLAIDCCADHFMTLDKRKMRLEFKFAATEIEVMVTNALGQTATSKMSFNI